jgi:DNA mismatch repair protein MutL
MIRVLSSDVANRIAAGEVVERPASVVKELLENALDAHARQLDLELEEGGVRLVRLRDDGDGMGPDDLFLCVQAHATSKIANVEDIFRVASFGFRGEALPSIASVSELSIVSRQAGEDTGYRIVVREGEVEGPSPAGTPQGTAVEVRQLFANVPARRRFLKQERTELQQCMETVTRLLLPDPDTGIRVHHNGRRVLEVGPDAGLRERIGTFFGRNLAKALLEVEAVDGSLGMVAFVGPPDLVRTHTRHQYIFLNGRFVRDRSLGVAIKEAYRNLIMPKDHPVVFLFLRMDPAEVDVNVHPQKIEVRFRDKDTVFRLVRGAIRARVLEGSEDRPLRIPTARSTPGEAPPPLTRQSLLQELEAEMFSGTDSDGGALPKTHLPLRVAESGPSVPPTPVAGPNLCKQGDASVVRPDPGRSTSRWMQVHRSYIVVETEDGLRIIDQHALHERRLFEELLSRFSSAESEDQHLLVPAVVDLGAPDQARLLDQAEVLLPLGIRVEPFGGTSVCVRSLPLPLSGADPEALIHDILDLLRGEGQGLDREHLTRELAAGLACRAAVKFNHALADEEIQALIRWSDAHPDSRNCPHGRPVGIALSLRDLENQFQRKK